MVPETTMTVTLGELARGMERLEKAQQSILTKLDTSTVSRKEFEAFKAEVAGRRVPWTAVAALAISALTALASLGVIG